MVVGYRAPLMGLEQKLIMPNFGLGKFGQEIGEGKPPKQYVRVLYYGQWLVRQTEAY